MTAEIASLPSAAPSAPAAGSSTDFVRLHISPLDSELLKIVLPAAVQSVARNVSFHTIDTFPERRYGFVELPQMDADKIKRKLHGATLKGSKMRIEKARPEERMEPAGEDDEVMETKQERKERKKKKKAEEEKTGSKKRKREFDVVQGVAISDRKVKRGWTDPLETKRKRSKKDKDSKDKAKDKDNDKDEDTEKAKPKQKEQDKKKRLKSKYTEQEECLLKTKVPPNAIGNIPEDTFRKKKRNKTKSREITVHEFEKTTKYPSFLKNAVPEGMEGKSATQFVEGKGWVDGEGDVVEAVKVKEVEVTKKSKAKPKPQVVEVEEEEDSDTSSSGTSSEGEDSDLDEPAEAEVDSDPHSNSDSDTQQARHATPPSTIKGDTSRPMSSNSSHSLTIKIPPPTTPSAPKVHPLEALYKKSKPDTTETPVQEPAQPFSFFGQADDDEEAEDESSRPSIAVPMTPFTKQDFDWRNVRSAAPTPDTAHPSRMQNFWAEQDGDVVDEDVLGEGEVADEAAPAQGSSDFQTWFWANRSQLNRSWMQRRKTVSKEKRHRENKARASKAV